MLTSITDGILCCLTGKTGSGVVLPVESSGCTDGFEFVEVKPGRVLRIRHIIPERPPKPDPEPIQEQEQNQDQEQELEQKTELSQDQGKGPGTGKEEEKEVSGEEGGSTVHCKRKITVYRNGQLVIENLGDVLHSEILQCQNGDVEPCTTLEVELADYNSATAATTPDPKPAPLPPTTSTGNGSAAAGPQKPAPPPRRKRRKPKRTVMIDSERKISSCKGTDADVALFFVHGVGGSLDIWGSQLNFFSRLGYEVIAPDLAGHGASTAPQIAAAYTFYALAEDLRAIFKRYARKRNILIGHSYGVSFCTFLAHEYPEQVHKVVMINGGGPTALEPSLCSIFQLPSCVLHCLSPCLAWSFLKAGFARQGAKEKQLLKEGNAFNVSPFVLRAMMSGQYWPEGDEVYHAELTVPILLVHGMYDKFVPMEEDQRMAEILLFAFLKVIEEGSHMVMMECPETVNTLLHEFFLWEPDTSKKDLPRPEPSPPARTPRQTAQHRPPKAASL
ncbi:LOW QUALITY PROTEIN: protein ABHD8 [Alosa sapidissima]|uniref:LOW QUALITY PROTEIN: protein ABHD8 n=1 Tax=Alosa sapidissima TaxID=34773 RepID=UPI001C098E7E|nr:LOW QUALITY PROTEIN: protein ABHD8 [Alosa sapidissima]